MLDFLSETLSAEERDLLDHPLVGGVILFARNYAEPDQLKDLVRQAREAARADILIAVDQEGGCVQRFKQGFTRIPAMGQLEQLANQAADAGALAYACGVTIGFELRQHDIDLSFAPVLDLSGVSDVIGDRGFADNVDDVVALASQFIRGLRTVGLKSVGKHFPGHGAIKADSHIAMPVDERSFAQIDQEDMQVFRRLIAQSQLDAVMPAHVIYSQVDSHPAGFSAQWLQRILRQDLGFSGTVFSDDLSMQAATVAGDACDRTEAALSAGCDMALVCNSRDSVINVLDNLPQDFYRTSRAGQLKPQPAFTAARFNAEYQRAKRLLSQMSENAQ
ncbi:beta-N-acetylhexosaminidase [Alteromonas oceanisediminis]|uniref:beta-N-acetylhexosaminidase n=1 Tax=Alteromonas oceanisediminis TaxID=2836180 RepID=UPI001BD9B3D4|nr:beta-N-acetylhexosaminidase [Alteromonas oceanisediminis]MBT0587269.1 beta-N-acetylhexosaminidase [Alteromonas oceanisediminis]